jgi:antitoxin PrlF
MITSKLTTKAQTTIPQAVRNKLGVHEGDILGFIFEGDRVVLTKPLPSAPQHDPITTFHEWDSTADAKAYAGL